jgi:hypothetical protein
MVKAPRRFDPGMLGQKEGVLQTEGLEPLDLYPELAALEACPAIAALMVGRKNLGFNPHSWLEIKHIGDTAETYKTRMYHLTWEGVTQHIARAGLKLEADETLARLHTQEGIPTIALRAYPSAGDIINKTYQDYVEIRGEQRVNTDYDYKRKPLDDGTTRPFATAAEFKRYREIMEGQRKGGRRSTPERVVATDNQMRLQKGEDWADMYRRYIHYAIAHGQPGWQSGAGPTATADMLGISYKNKFKHYASRPFAPYQFERSPLLEQIAHDEAAKIGRTLSPGMLAMLVCSPEPPSGP